MTFSKKVQTNQGGSSISGDQWNEWNEHLWKALDVEPFAGAGGKMVKEATEIGVLNFIMELGSQSDQFAKMKSKVAPPKDGEEFSSEELAEMEKRPNNKYFWDSEWRDGVQHKVRKVKWPVDPEEELVLAIDFPMVKIDYSKHPAANGVGETKPLRIDYNGRGKGEFKHSFQRRVSNEVNWKTGAFGNNDIKYKIAQAVGNLEEYKNDSHDLAHLVQATTNWTIRATRTEKDGNVYYDMTIKNPEKIQDIKTRKDTYTVAEQLEDAQCDVPFCGILMDSGDYPEENLTQVRAFWWEKAKQAVTFDKNEGKEGKDPWIKGLGWDGSDLQKAYDSISNDKPSQKPVEQPQGTPSQEGKQTPAQSSKPVEKPAQEPDAMFNSAEEDDWSDDVPF